jgi:hypothetical protein
MAYEQSANSRPPKQEKREMDYSLGNPERHCGRLTDTDSDFCRHFIPHREERAPMCRRLRVGERADHSDALVPALFDGISAAGDLAPPMPYQTSEVNNAEQ